MTEKIKNFTDLNAWKEGHQLVIETYKTTKHYPKEEIFGLTNQMRRAAVSITSNIAEGFGRQTMKEKVQFYSMALGSLVELQNQIILSKDIDYLTESEFDSLEDRYITVQKIICGLIKASKNRI